MFTISRTRLLAGAATLALTASLGATPGLAQENPATGNMTVIAAIAQSCSLGAIDTLDFGAITPGQVKEADANFVVSCTIGSGNVTVDFGSSTSWVMTEQNGSSAEMQFQLYPTESRGIPWSSSGIDKTITGLDTTMTVYGSVPATFSEGKPQGNYEGQVTISVAF